MKDLKQVPLKDLNRDELVGLIYLVSGEKIVAINERDEARKWARRMKSERDYFEDQAGLQDIDTIRHNLIEMGALADRVELDQARREIVRMKERLELITQDYVNMRELGHKFEDELHELERRQIEDSKKTG